MMKHGHILDLPILRRKPEGLILGDEEEQVIIPLQEARHGDVGDRRIRVYVERGANGGWQATTQLPKVSVGRFARLRVLDLDGTDVLVERGVEPPLRIPETEQHAPMERGRWYTITVVTDRRTGALVGTSRVEDHLDNRVLRVEEGDKVDLLVFARSPIGLSVIVNDRHQGLVHASDVFRPVDVGDRVEGWVRRIRPDNKLDIVLQPIGYRSAVVDHSGRLEERLRRQGSIPFSDRSAPEDILDAFGMSKKSFKQAIGNLYRQRLVRIEDDRVVWIGPRR
jgi:predicted RNA-binding protein (virulence factor B family)